MSLDDIPGRVFLDTSVVNFMLDYGEQIFDNVDIPKGTDSLIAEEVEALRNVYITGNRANWQLAVSPFTYKEVIGTKDLSRRCYLEEWFFEIWNYWQEILEENNDLPSFIDAEKIRINLLSSNILDVLTDVEDKVLICDAIVYQCDCFCTRDFKTILK